MSKKVLGQSLRIAAYVKARRAKLDLLEKMWADPLVQCYNDVEMPSRSDEIEVGSAFLVGPTSRHQILEYNYRCEEVAYLRQAGFKGYIYVPEPRGLGLKGDYPSRTHIHYWESNRLFGQTLKEGATHKVVWIPRDADELLGLNTNLEFGMMLGMIAAEKRMNLFAGWPDEAERMGLPDHYSVVMQGVKRHNTLRRLCYAVVGKVPPEDIERS